MVRSKDALRAVSMLAITGLIAAIGGSSSTVVASPDTPHPHGCVPRLKVLPEPIPVTYGLHPLGFIRQEGLLDHRCRITGQTFVVYSDPMLTTPIEDGEGLPEGTSVLVNGTLNDQVGSAVSIIAGWGVKVIDQNGIIRQGWIPDGEFKP